MNTENTVGLELRREDERAILAAMDQIEGAVNVVYARLADLRGYRPEHEGTHRTPEEWVRYALQLEVEVDRLESVLALLGGAPPEPAQYPPLAKRAQTREDG